MADNVVGWLANLGKPCYAALEIAETIRTSPAAADWREEIVDAAESPFLPTRSIQIQLFNEKLEREW